MPVEASSFSTRMFVGFSSNVCRHSSNVCRYSPNLRRMFVDNLSNIRRMFLQYSSNLRRMFVDIRRIFVECLSNLRGAAGCRRKRRRSAALVLEHSGNGVLSDAKCPSTCNLHVKCKVTVKSLKGLRQACFNQSMLSPTQNTHSL